MRGEGEEREELLTTNSGSGDVVLVMEPASGLGFQVDGGWRRSGLPRGGGYKG